MKKILLITLLLTGCSKEWLDIKPVKSAVVLSTPKDFQAVLDNINTCHSTQALGEIGSDNYYISQQTLASADAFHVISYLWALEGWKENTSVTDWLGSYKTVNHANICLEGIEKVPQTAANKAEWNNVKGTALFVRAVAFYNIGSLFASPSWKSSAPGIPLRLESDPNMAVGRGTVETLYHRILLDLTTSLEYLPDVSPYQIRPTKQAVYGMLARICLSMEDYAKALSYANKYLDISHTLLDYNTLSVTPNISFPAPNNNPEITYYSRMQNNMLTQARCTVDSTLYNSYAPNDLRKAVFFRKTTSGSPRIIWAGSYTGSVSQHFSGIAADEAYLIRAECNARIADYQAGMKDLNDLLRKRFLKNQFIELIAADRENALSLILSERRKELAFRGLRWTDIKRFNRDARYKTIIKRYSNELEYTLPPDYLFPIPADEILQSGIEQN